MLSSDLSRARQSTELLTNNLTQDITITYNDILQEVGLIRIDTSLTSDEDQFLVGYTHSCRNICVVIAFQSKRHYQHAKDAYNFFTTFNIDRVCSSQTSLNCIYYVTAI